MQVLGFKVVFLHKTPPSSHALGLGKLLVLAGLTSVLQHLVISQSEASTVTHQPIGGQHCDPSDGGDQSEMDEGRGI